MVGATCVVRECFNNKGIQHRFPIPHKKRALFDLWVQLCDNKRLLQNDPMKTYANCRVCHRHFPLNDVGPNNKLKPGSYPKLHLPEIPSTSTAVEVAISEATHLSKDVDISPVPSTSTAVEVPISEATHLSQDVDISSIPSTSRDGRNVTAEPRCFTPVLTDHQRTGILKKLNISRQTALSPKARSLYVQTTHLKKKVAALKRARMTLKQRLQHASKLSNTLWFRQISTLDRIKARFFLSQIENVNKKTRGHRYTLDDKVLALALFKQSPTAYSFLSNIFSLPSRKTLLRLLQQVPIAPGFNETIFEVLGSRIKHIKNDKEKFCTLLFDEMSIAPHFSFNCMKDCVEGFENFGYKTTKSIANHVQVFMLRGVFKRWKQPILYSFVSGAAKAAEISRAIKEIIGKCQTIGLTVVATISDQGTNNVAALKSLINETRASYLKQGKEFPHFIFEVNGESIFPVYDPPHLIKGLRNNLLKGNLHFSLGGEPKVAKWEHLVQAYKMDGFFGSLRTMPKLTEKHVNAQEINKMKVSYCTQVFSRSVAVGMQVMAYSGTSILLDGAEVKLDRDAMDTAKLFEFLDNLFDSVNSRGLLWAKPLKNSVRSDSEHLKFWCNAKQVLNSMKYKSGDRTFVPPSVTNFIITINNFEMLFKLLQSHGFQHMATRNFNQDPLENFFSKIRQQGSRCANPSSETFTAFYKTLLVKNVTSIHSLGANCEDDKSEIFVTLQNLVQHQGAPSSRMQSETFSDIPTDLPLTKGLQHKILIYIMGFVVSKVLKVHNCSVCSGIMLCTPTSDHELVKRKEFDTVQRLKYVSRDVAVKLNVAYNIIQFVLYKDIHKCGLKQHIVNTLCNKIKLSPCQHDDKLKHLIFNKLVNVVLYSHLNQVNRIMAGKDLRQMPQNAPSIFKLARDVYLKTHKKKVIRY